MQTHFLAIATAVTVKVKCAARCDVGVFEMWGTAVIDSVDHVRIAESFHFFRVRQISHGDLDWHKATHVALSSDLMVVVTKLERR